MRGETPALPQAGTGARELHLGRDVDLAEMSRRCASTVFLLRKSSAAILGGRRSIVYEGPVRRSTYGASN